MFEANRDSHSNFCTGFAQTRRYSQLPFGGLPTLRLLNLRDPSWTAFNEALRQPNPDNQTQNLTHPDMGPPLPIEVPNCAAQTEVQLGLWRRRGHGKADVKIGFNTCLSLGHGHGSPTRNASSFLKFPVGGCTRLPVLRVVSTKGPTKGNEATSVSPKSAQLGCGTTSTIGIGPV